MARGMGGRTSGALLRVGGIWQSGQGVELRGALGCCLHARPSSRMLACGFVQLKPSCWGGVSVKEAGNKAPLSGPGSASSLGLKL